MHSRWTWEESYFVWLYECKGGRTFNTFTMNVRIVSYGVSCSIHIYSRIHTDIHEDTTCTYTGIHSYPVIMIHAFTADTGGVISCFALRMSRKMGYVSSDSIMNIRIMSYDICYKSLVFLSAKDDIPHQNFMYSRYVWEGSWSRIALWMLQKTGDDFYIIYQECKDLMLRYLVSNRSFSPRRCTHTAPCISIHVFMVVPEGVMVGWL